MDANSTDTFLLTDECKQFLNHLHLKFNSEHQQLLTTRKQRQEEIDRGVFPDFLAASSAIRNDNWQAAAIPKSVQDRRVEITGPVDRKMVINALNSGAKVFMADFEDSNAPTWSNCLDGQKNLFDAVRGTIEYQQENSDKRYALNEDTAILMVRPRGWHLDEVHYDVNQQAISASLFDFGVFAFHNAQYLLEQGKNIFFYLPKLESHEEAQLWESVIAFSEAYLTIPQNSIKITVLIETITAVFEMDEIIFALKNRIIGLNCGRWDYIFSFIKKFRQHKAFVLPDREQVTMSAPFLNAYVELLVYTCHRRGIHAMGGMAAQIPIKDDNAANEAALAKVKADKLREVKAGHDGTWVAHPGLIPIAMEIFNKYMPSSNQIMPPVSPPKINAGDLLSVPKGTITVKSVKNNIRVALEYLRAWLAGNGCVPVGGLMEDAATAEICRAQLWQWYHYESNLEGGGIVDESLLRNILQEQARCINDGLQELTHKRYLQQSISLLEQMIFDKEFVDFLTLSAYPILNTNRS